MKAQDMTWPVLICALIGAFGLLFAANLGYWWAAHQLPWWVFGLFASATTFISITVKSTVKTLRKRRKGMT